jgi:LPS-assembly lipoprotein
LVAGCGFRPIYADRAVAPGVPGVADELAATRVALIPDRPGQLLRAALNRRLRNGADVPVRSELKVALSFSRQAVGVRRDVLASRVRVAAVADYALTALPSGEAIASGRAFAVDAFNIAVNEYFAAQVSGEVAEQRLTERLADDIVAQLAVFHARRSARAS